MRIRVRSSMVIVIMAVKALSVALSRLHLDSALEKQLEKQQKQQQTTTTKPHSHLLQICLASKHYNMIGYGYGTPVGTQPIIPHRKCLLHRKCPTAQARDCESIIRLEQVDARQVTHSRGARDSN